MSNEYHAASLEAFLDDQSYLKHYGVLGMKWGVRNAETLRKYNGGFGSRLRKKRLERARDSAYRDSENLREAGYITESQAVRKVGDKHQTKLERLESTQSEKERNDDRSANKNNRTNHTTIKDLSDSELNALNNRMQNEINFYQKQAQLREITEQANLTQSDRIKRAIGKELISVGKNAIKGWATTQTRELLNKNLGFGDTDFRVVASYMKQPVSEIIDATSKNRKG